jgi:putative DNA primase/helicase
MNNHSSPDLRDIELQIAVFMEANGIMPPRDGLILDGVVHRFAVERDKGAAKSGAYCIHLDGWPAGWVQDFHLGDPIKWRYDTGNLDANARAEWGRRVKSSEITTKRAEEESQRQEERRQALASAWSIYESARPIEEAPDHPYLLAKHVRPVGPLRVGDVPSSKTPGKIIHDVLLIPCFSVLSGEFVALHRVFPFMDKITGKYPKGWFPGTSGGVFFIAGDVTRGPVFVAEGISTGLSWYQYWNEESGSTEPCMVIAAMDAGNLIKQAAAIRARYPGRDIFILQDDDKAGEQAACQAMASGFTGVVNPRDYIR